MSEASSGSIERQCGPVLVTGATGFIGRSLVPRLLDSGYRVRCLVRSSSMERAKQRLPPGVAVAWGDLLDTPSLLAAVEDCSGVIHLASVSSWADISSPRVGPVVVEGTQRILAAAKQAQVSRFLYVSSVAALGPCRSGELLHEDSMNPIPSGLRYASAKREAGEAVMSESGITTMVAYPAEVYGANDLDGVTVPNLIRLARQRPRLVPRGGTAVVHVDDVAAALCLIYTNGIAGGRYLLAGDNLSLAELGNVVLRQLVQPGKYREISPALLRLPAAIEKYLGIPLGLQPDLLAYAFHRWYADSRSTQKTLGLQFRPAVEAIRDALEGIEIK